MTSKIIIINNPIGLHSRLAATFVEQAKRFQSEIKLQKGEIFCNAKEFLKILKLSITDGSSVTLWCDGVDEEQALTILSHYLEFLSEQDIPMLSSEEALKVLKPLRNP